MVICYYAHKQTIRDDRNFIGAMQCVINKSMIFILYKCHRQHRLWAPDKQKENQSYGLQT